MSKTFKFTNPNPLKRTEEHVELARKFLRAPSVEAVLDMLQKYVVVVRFRPYVGAKFAYALLGKGGSRLRAFVEPTHSRGARLFGTKEDALRYLKRVSFAEPYRIMRLEDVLSVCYIAFFRDPRNRYSTISAESLLEPQVAVAGKPRAVRMYQTAGEAAAEIVRAQEKRVRDAEQSVKEAKKGVATLKRVLRKHLKA